MTLYLETSPSLCRTAGDLAERYHLRGYDGVHLACFLEVARRAGPADTEFSCFDDRLNALHAGLCAPSPVAGDPACIHDLRRSTPSGMSPDPMIVSVECYAGYRAEQTPRALALHGRRIELVSILDQWLAPDHRYFKAADAAGDVYIVRHDVERDRWELTLFQRRGV